MDAFFATLEQHRQQKAAAADAARLAAELAAEEERQAVSKWMTSVFDLAQDLKGFDLSLLPYVRQPGAELKWLLTQRNYYFTVDLPAHNGRGYRPVEIEVDLSEFLPKIAGFPYYETDPLMSRQVRRWQDNFLDAVLRVEYVMEGDED